MLRDSVMEEQLEKWPVSFLSPSLSVSLILPSIFFSSQLADLFKSFLVLAVILERCAQTSNQTQ